MRNFLSLVGLLVMAIVGMALATDASDWKGLGDTAKVQVAGTATVWGKAMKLSKYEAVMVTLALRDTSATGFANDSIAVVLKYRSFHYCYNTSGVADTCVTPTIVIDTMTSVGTMTAGTMSDLANTTYMPEMRPCRANKLSDTTMCSGYAVLSRWINPAPDQFIQFGCTGLAANDKTGPIGYLQLDKRPFLQIKEYKE
jgi:hypothetical protein